jgi:hypothetical protein
MLIPKTASERAKPGQKANKGALSIYCLPSLLSILPQEGTLGGKPKPRKLRLASDKIALPTPSVKLMIIGAKIFGKMCRIIVRIGPLPMASAAEI